MQMLMQDLLWSYRGQGNYYSSIEGRPWPIMRHHERVNESKRPVTSGLQIGLY